MTYYGSETSPVSEQPMTEGSTDALQSAEAPEGAEAIDEDLGDGFRKQSTLRRMLPW